MPETAIIGSAQKVFREETKLKKKLGAWRCLEKDRDEKL
jgi:hypothetical protein